MDSFGDCSISTARAFDYFAPTVKLIRVMRGMKQKDVVERSGLTKSMVSDFERGKRRPSRSSLESYLEALHADLGLYYRVSLVVREIVESARAKR